MTLFELTTGVIINLDHLVFVDVNKYEIGKFNFYLSHKLSETYIIGTQKDYEEIKKLCSFPEKKHPIGLR